MRTLLTHAQEYLRTVFSIDARSLATTRVGVSMVLLWELVMFLPHLTAFFLSSGVLPLNGGPSLTALNFMAWSIHGIIDSPYWVGLLFAIHIAAALAILVGYRTRLATIVAFVLTLSSEHATMLLLQSGDTILRLLLLFGIFLPWGTAYSVDAARAGYVSRQPAYYSPWTIATLGQILLFYAFAQMHKTGPSWVDGTAVYYATASVRYQTPLGGLLHSFPPLTSALTYATLLIQRFAVLLPLSPVRNAISRLVFLALFVCLHIGFMLSLHIEWFGVIVIAALLLWLPALFWDTLGNVFCARGFGGVTIYYDGECNFCRTAGYLAVAFGALPHSTVIPAQSLPLAAHLMNTEDSWVVRDTRGVLHTQFAAGLAVLRASPLFFWIVPLMTVLIPLRIGDRLYRLVARNRPRTCPVTPEGMQDERAGDRALSFFSACGAALVLSAIVFMNAYDLSHNTVRGGDRAYPFAIGTLMHTIGLSQRWDLFSPEPSRTLRWPVVDLYWSDGSHTDPLRNNAPTTSLRPAAGEGPFDDLRWSAYLEHTVREGESPAHRKLAAYLCRTARRDDHVPLSITLILFLKPLDVPAEKPQALTLFDASCADLLAERAVF